MVGVVYPLVSAAISLVDPVVHAMLTGQSTGKVRSPACRANGRVAERVCELEPVLCEPVDVRGDYLRIAVSPCGPHSHVIDKNEEDVGTTCANAMSTIVRDT